MKILEEFWYGNIHPNERHGESNIEMIKISDLIKRHEETLMKSLDEKNLIRLIYVHALLATDEGDCVSADGITIVF